MVKGLNFDTAVVIILYNPDYSKVVEKVSSLTANLSCSVVVLVDNSKEIFDTQSIGVANLIYISNGENLGIATAQNIGVKKALELGVEYVVFFDQDSDFSSGYVVDIISEFKRIKEAVVNLAILGPKVFRESTQEEYSSIFYKDQVDESDFIRKDSIISSGCCVSSSLFGNIGYFEDRLFIDLVDFEYCWRAIKNGYSVGLTPNLTMPHTIGQREIKIFKYRIIISSPFRYFYQYRNFLWLSCRGYVPLIWKLKTGIRYILRLIYFPFVLKGGFEIERYMFRGIFASFKSK